MSLGRGADDTSSRRGVDDIFSMVEYIKRIYQGPLKIMCT